jgi:predicted  nucleic acid-binding Zn-ribbon protein
VTNLMRELQRMEAKQADFNHMISENEAEIDRIVSRLENQKKQIEMIEMTMIPMLEHEISSVEGGIDQLTEEIGTNLTSTFGRGPQHAGAAQKDASRACFRN